MCLREQEWLFTYMIELGSHLVLLKCNPQPWETEHDFCRDEELHHVTVLSWRKQVGCLFHVKLGSQSLNELKCYFKLIHMLLWSCWPFSPDIPGAKQYEKPDSQWKWDFCLWFKLSLVKQIQHWRHCHVKRIYLTLVETSFIMLSSHGRAGHTGNICVFRSLPFHLLQT